MHSLEVSPGKHAAEQDRGNDEVTSIQEVSTIAAALVAVVVAARLPVHRDTTIFLRDFDGGNDMDCVNAQMIDDSSKVLWRIRGNIMISETKYW